MGVACGWRLVIRDQIMEEHRNLRLQGEETCPSCLTVQQSITSSSSLRRTDTSLFMLLFYLVWTSLPVPIALYSVTWGCNVYFSLDWLISLVPGQGTVPAMLEASIDADGQEER